MPIRVLDELPAVNFLREENVRHDDFSRIRSGNSPAKGVFILNLDAEED